MSRISMEGCNAVSRHGSKIAFGLSELWVAVSGPCQVAKVPKIGVSVGALFGVHVTNRQGCAGCTRGTRRDGENPAFRGPCRSP
jgi:hypothetical protein